ncbi:rhodanese-like domain-containing protein, partial [bacterium]|nr:rhodanese-like domain-containing protein [bacterium]
EPIPWTGKKTDVVAGRAGAFPVITLDDAYTMYEQGKIRFIDAREPSDFAAGHLPGAVNIPVEKAEDHLAVFKSPGFSGKDFVIYCSGPECPLSRELAEKLAARGMKGLVILPDGWSGWYGSGFPIEGKGAGQ